MPRKLSVFSRELACEITVTKKVKVIPCYVYQRMSIEYVSLAAQLRDDSKLRGRCI